jgi:hypothetical protein
MDSQIEITRLNKKIASLEDKIVILEMKLIKFSINSTLDTNRSSSPALMAIGDGACSDY